jgi:hypothetical protein
MLKRLPNKFKVLAILIPVILFGMFMLVSGTTQQPKQAANPPTGMPAPTEVSVTAAQAVRKAPVTYSKSGLATLNARLKNPQPLSKEDAIARQKLLASLKESSGLVYRTENYRIEYLKSPDEFMIEVLSIDIGKAKTDAVNWLTAQGLSHSGVCNLPVIFYLNSSVAKQIRPLNMTFSPVPDNCY